MIALKKHGRRLLNLPYEDPATIRQARLLQLLVALAVTIALARAALYISAPFSTAQSFRPLLPAALIAGTGLLAVICSGLVFNGRLSQAVHLFCGGLTCLFLAELVLHPQPPAVLVYLALIPLIAIAVLDSIPVSFWYTAVTATAVTLISIIPPSLTLTDIILFWLTIVTINIIIWAKSHVLQKTAGEADRLTQDIRHKNNLLQRRARQLQLSAEVGQRTSFSLDLPELLEATVSHIRDQFGFYYVSIFFIDDAKQILSLREATGQIGQTLKERGYALSVNQNSIIGWTASHQKPRISHDVSEDPNFLAEPLLQETKAELCLPLIARGELLGVLDVQSRVANAFQEEDISILQIMANQVAINIDNAQLFSQTQERLSATKTLYDMNVLLTTTLDVGEIYRRAAREFTLRLGVTRCVIASWEKEENNIASQAEFVRDLDGNPRNEYVTTYRTLSLTDHPAMAAVLETHHPLIRRISDANLSTFELKQFTELNQQTSLTLALIYGVEALGIVTLFRDATKPAFDDGDIQLAQTMANQTAVALNNAILTSNTRGQLAQFSSLHRMSNILSQAPSLKVIFEGARREILSLVEATGMSISLLTPEGDKLNWIYGFEYGQEVDLSQIPPLPITEGFSGHVARTREVFYVQKAQELREEFDSVTVGADLGYWLGLPMIVANRLIGVLAVENDIAFSKRDIELLKTIVGPLAIAINNLIQFEEVQAALEVQSRQRIQLQTAAEVAAAATSIQELDELTRNAVNLIKERFALYYVGLFLVDEATQEAVLTAGTGEAGNAQLAAGRRLPVGGHSLIGGATADGRARITQDVTQDKEWLPNPHLPETRSELALPLRVRRRIIGALTVQSNMPDVFDEELISTLQTMSDQLAVAIENARLLSQAEAKARDQAQIRQISAQFHQSADVEQIVRLGMQAISERLQSTDVQIHLGAPQDGRLPATEDKRENGRFAAH